MEINPSQISINIPPSTPASSPAITSGILDASLPFPERIKTAYTKQYLKLQSPKRHYEASSRDHGNWSGEHERDRPRSVLERHSKWRERRQKDIPFRPRRLRR